MQVTGKPRYYPFGDWRTEPTANLTDRGFTGHLHNNIGNAPDDIGLVYMQARWYLPGLGRFASADTIIPNPANPQSYNRYAYVENRPLNFSDPTGHREEDCDYNVCNLPSSSPPQLDPLVDFDSEGDEAWTDDEKSTIESAALDVAGALARTYNRDQRDLWKIGLIDAYRPVTARQAFLSVYGGPVTFIRKSSECAEDCFGRTISAQEIWVYSNATSVSDRFIVHELGHAFENALEAIVGYKPPRTLLAAVQANDSNFPNRFVTGQDPPYGFAGNFPGWQQSQQADAYEEYADMYIGWTYNTWAANDAGRARASFMSNNMPLWVDLAISR
ncbi:MAG: hypothetical protein BroJett015_43730 [Chloroflexota bacterium]|nr:MAG: hypothetical protein BroJett015_43730 [Chloroflexota bacterium]